MPERKTSIAEAADLLTQPFTHTVLGQVDDYCAYLSRFDGTYKFHEHAKDEMYLVLQGEILIDYYDGPSVPVRQGEGLVVKAGERHRSRAEAEALVLLFKAAHLFAE
jgi:mannose-6-phosphate isomerase-like protein (cupin superfamily)